MRIKYLIISFFLLYCNFNLFGQDKKNSLNLSVGYPKNLSKHWLADDFKDNFNIKARYLRHFTFLTFGGGVNYSSYNITWFRNYYQGNNNLNDVTPYLTSGINIEKNKFVILPNINLGYSFIGTNISIYNGSKNGIFFSGGSDLNFKVSKTFQIGFNVYYNMIFAKMDFNTEGRIFPTDFIPTESKFMKSLIVGLNSAFKF